MADRFPSGWMTKRSWIREFIDALTDAHAGRRTNGCDSHSASIAIRASRAEAEAIALVGA
jgi:hypothetical protein